MSPDYKNLRGEADKLFYRFKNVVDDTAAASGLAGEVRGVVEDFDSNKNARFIEDRIKRLIESLKALRRSGSDTMDAGNVAELIDKYEELRQQVRKADNY